MNEITMTRREAKQARVVADRKALHAKFIKPIKAVTVVSLVSAFFLTGSMSAMAATSEPSLGTALTADQMSGTPSLGTALTEAQMNAALNAALNSAPSQTITGVSGTNDGLNIDVDMSDASTILVTNTVADDGNGTYKVEVVASGAGAGNFNNLIGSKFSQSFGANDATIIVTDVNGNTVSLDISLESVPNVTPTFTATGSSTGPAPVAPKTAPTVSDVREILDTTTQATATWDVLAKQTPSLGYAWDATSLMFINSVTGSATPTQRTNGATLAVVNGKVEATSIPFWSGFPNLTMTAKEKWAGAPGTEPAGWTPATITFQLKLEIVGAEPVLNSPTDCTVAAAPSGGTGFSVPMASSGSTGLACNLVAVADTVTIAPDAMEAAVKAGAQDVPTNTSYQIDPDSIQYRTADGTGFAKDVTYPGQFSLSYDSKTGITTPKRIGKFAEKVQVLRTVSEYKLDANGNKVVGGTSSALLTLDFQPVATPEIPVTVPETPVTTPEIPAPVVPETPVADTTNTPVPTPVASSNSRPFNNLGNTSAAAPASKAASVAPKGTDNNGILAAELGLLALGAAGAFVIKARHRKTQISDVRA